MKDALSYETNVGAVVQISYISPYKVLRWNNMEGSCSNDKCFSKIRKSTINAKKGHYTKS